MTEQFDELYSCTILDAGGSRVGGVSQVYLDDATGEPTFVAVRSGLFGNKEVLVPLGGAFISDGLMQVPFAAELVKQAPAPRADRRLTPEQEAEIHRHFGLDFVLPTPPAAAEPALAAPPQPGPAASGPQTPHLHD